MGVELLTELLGPVTSAAAGRTLAPELAEEFDRQFPSDGPEFEKIFSACRRGIAEGWLCTRGGDGLKFGRAVKPGPILDGFSVDVVDMTDIVGPYHSHPNGEIDLVMPIDPDAQFDGKGAGWVVYAPGTAHRPTVSFGRALVLYLLPGGAIDFNAP